MNDYKKKILKLFQREDFPYYPQHCVHHLFKNKKVVLYGAGDGYITFSIFILNRYGLDVRAILDRKFKRGDVFEGIPAFSPDDYQLAKDEIGDTIVVVTVGKKEFQDEIRICLDGLGFKHIVSPNDIYEYHLLHPEKELKEKGFRYFVERQDNILLAYDRLDDELSREIFYTYLKTHMQRKPCPIPSDPLEDQYFPKNLTLSKGYSRVINCGSYNGDTVKQIHHFHGKVDALACFEPEPENFKRLTRYLIDEADNVAGDIMAFPCGVFSSISQFRFKADRRINSMISDDGDTVIQCVSLDCALPKFRPTFINMDIEGAEFEAIKGARLMLCHDKSDLAICVYHTPSHLWDILLYLDALDVGYKFYLRNYTSFITETVLYATA